MWRFQVVVESQAGEHGIPRSRVFLGFLEFDLGVAVLAKHPLEGM